MVEYLQPFSSLWRCGAVVEGRSSVQGNQADPEYPEANDSENPAVLIGTPNEEHQGNNAQDKTRSMGDDINLLLSRGVSVYTFTVFHKFIFKSIILKFTRISITRT